MADETKTFISGRGQRTAFLLLTAAAQLEHPKYVVEAQRLGYLVPNDVAERYEVLKTELDDAEAARAASEPEKPAEPEQPTDEEKLAAEADAEPEKPAAAKAPAKKTAAKKTAAKTPNKE